MKYLSLLLVSIVLAACSPAEVDRTPISDPTASTPPAGAASEKPTSAPPSPSHDMAAMSAGPAVPNGEGGEVVVEISNFAFAPAAVSVSAGTSVTWINRDSAPHTVTAGTDDDPRPEVFDSGLLEQGETFTVVFESDSFQAYFCERHPPMEGKISVGE